MFSVSSRLLQEASDCADQLRRVVWSIESGASGKERIADDLDRLRQRIALLSDIQQERLCTLSLERDTPCDTSSDQSSARSR